MTLPAPALPVRRYVPVAGVRIDGLDLARGLAILGMFVAHLLVPEEPVWSEPSSWIGLVNGRSAALFAILAGVSLALLSGRTVPATGDALLRARLRIGSRALLIFVVGGLVGLIPANVAVILPYYAAAFLVGVLFLSVRPAILFTIAAGIAVLGPFVQVPLALALNDGELSGTVLTDLFVTGYYPVLLWSAYVLLGLGLGRLALEQRAVIARIAAAGAVLLVVGVGGAALLGAMLDLPAHEYWLGDYRWDNLLYATAHSGSTWDLLGTAGFALLVIAAALALPHAVQRVLFPIRAVGKMALTAYVAHLVALGLLGGAGMTSGDPVIILLYFLAATLVVCSLWITVFRRGPLETLITSLSRAAAATRPSA